MLIHLNPDLLTLLSIVEPEEIRRLSRSFKKLDLNQDGSLSVDEFLAMPELQQNPLVRRVIDILDTDRNGEVDFQGTGQWVGSSILVESGGWDGLMCVIMATFPL